MGSRHLKSKQEVTCLHSQSQWLPPLKIQFDWSAERCFRLLLKPLVSISQLGKIEEGYNLNLHLLFETSAAISRNKVQVNVLFMAALCNRAGRYIFALFFLSSSFFFFFFSLPNLSGRILDVYHTLHLVWPECEFRMQVWNVLRAAHCKYRMQKNRQKVAIWAPSHKFVGLYLRN